MKEYVGIGKAKVSINEDAYTVLKNMDRAEGLISENDLDVLNKDGNIKVNLINSQNIDGEHIDIYGLASNEENGGDYFDIVKVK